MRLRVMLVERSTLVRHGFRRILEDEGDIAIVADVATRPEAVEALATVTVDVVVISTAIDRDACRPSAIASLRTADLGIVCVHHWADSRDVEAALAAGAHACVEISDALDGDFRHAVRMVSRAERYLSPGLRAAMPLNGSSFEPDCERLTAREREVLVLIARSLSNREIARELNLSANTVAVHRNHIMKKVGVRKATALAVFAAERGLLPRK